MATQDIGGDGICEVMAVSGPNSPSRMRFLNVLTDAALRESPAMPGLNTADHSVGEKRMRLQRFVCEELASARIGSNSSMPKTVDRSD